MTEQLKEMADIVPADFQVSPVWEYALDREVEGESLVRPVLDLPARTLDLRFVGAPVRLANCQVMPAMIANVTVTDPYRTHQFISLSLYKNEWFGLARYYDADLDQNGPAALAEFLGLTIEEVFPISYDLRAYCIGNPDALAGKINVEPSERLTDKERLRLVLSQTSS